MPTQPKKAAKKDAGRMKATVAARVLKLIDPPGCEPMPRRIIAWWERPYGYWHFEQVCPHKFDEKTDHHKQAGRHVRIISLATELPTLTDSHAGDDGRTIEEIRKLAVRWRDKSTGLVLHAAGEDILRILNQKATTPTAKGGRR